MSTVFLILCAVFGVAALTYWTVCYLRARNGNERPRHFVPIGTALVLLFFAGWFCWNLFRL